MQTSQNYQSDFDTLKTINSLEKLDDNLYTITFYGDYGQILDDVNQEFTGNSYSAMIRDSIANFYCSLFSVFGNPNVKFFGRSFDNPPQWRCLTLVGRYNPPDGYSSIALMRMRDIGYGVGTDFENLSYNEKLPLIEAAFHVPDGINEHGVVAALANVTSWNYTPDSGKKTIWITLLVREILDHAKNVDEAIAIAQNYNVCCPAPGRLNVHTMVADPSGKSVILEMYNGELMVVENTEQWHVVTNSPSYNVPIEQQKAACGRFRTIYNSLETADGNIGESNGLNLLQNVGYPYTQWSAVYNMTEKKVTLSLDYDFNNLFYFSFNEN